MLPEITIDLSSPGLRDDTRPMNGAECLKRWGTMSIGLDVMQDRIRVGQPTVYDLADGTQAIRWDPGTQVNAWLFMQFVPEAFQDIAVQGLRDSLAKNEGWKITSRMAMDVAYDAHISILRQLESRERWLWLCESWATIGLRAMRDTGATPYQIHVASLDVD